MNLGDIIKSGLAYPMENLKSLIILGVIFTFIQILSSMEFITGEYILLIISMVLSVILTVFIYGYSLDIIVIGIDRGSGIPIMDASDFVKGLKSIVVSIVYYIIPLIVSVITAYLSGLFSTFPRFYNYVASLNSTTSNVTEIANSMPQDLVLSVGTSLLITITVSILVFIIFTLFGQIALARLAETDSIKESISLGKILSKISEIGWLKYIGYLIFVFIIVMIVLLVSSFISMIPTIGVFIISLIISPYIFLFLYYSLGLLYSSNIGDDFEF